MGIFPLHKPVSMCVYYMKNTMIDFLKSRRLVVAAKGWSRSCAQAALVTVFVHVTTKRKYMDVPYRSAAIAGMHNRQIA